MQKPSPLGGLGMMLGSVMVILSGHDWFVPIVRHFFAWAGSLLMFFSAWWIFKATGLSALQGFVRPPGGWNLVKGLGILALAAVAYDDMVIFPDRPVGVRQLIPVIILVAVGIEEIVTGIYLNSKHARTD